MIFFFLVRIFFSTSNSSGQATFCTYSQPEYKGDETVFQYIFLFSLFSFFVFVFVFFRPVITLNQGMCNLMLIFSVLICFINLEMLWLPFFGMNGVCGVTFPIHGLCNFSHLCCASGTRSNTGTQTGFLNTGILVFKYRLLRR